MSRILSEYSIKQVICLFIISAVMFMENIDAHILNIAIPQMANTFETSVFVLKLAVTSYLIGLSIFIPISGWVADKYGTRTTLIFSIVLFTVLSFICGITNSVAMLVVCRLLQGVAGAFMVPIGRLLLLKIFDKSQMVKAYTIMGIPVMIAPIVAPILGGYLVSYFSWRYIFWINLPVGFLVLIATIKNIDNYKEVPDKFNLINFIFLSLLICAVCLLLDILLLVEFPLLIKAALAVFIAIVGSVYYWLESGSDNQVIKYHLFKIKTFFVTFFATIIVRASLGGRAFIIAVYLEICFHLSAFEAGFYFIWMATGVLTSRTIVRNFLNKHGFKKTLTVSNIGSCVAMLMLLFSGELGVVFYIALYLNGFFASAQFMSMNILYYADVPKEDYSAAVSLVATWQQLGTSLGVIVAAGALHVFSGVFGHGLHSTSPFYLVFIMLACINLCSQFLIHRLSYADGMSLLKPKSI